MPDDSSLSVVCPIRKKVDPNVCANYRGIVHCMQVSFECHVRTMKTSIRENEEPVRDRIHLVHESVLVLELLYADDRYVWYGFGP